MDTLIAPVISALKEHHATNNFADVERAFVVAEKAHTGQLRKSGDAYITHPVAVANILAELGLTSEAIIAALLHDTVEDTAYSLKELRHDFGDEIAGLVDGVTKLDKLTYGPTAEAETVRKMVVAMSRDIRVLVIKLADRLHNARTWKYVSPESAQRKARETLDIYAPLAHRLGMNAMKWELEDLSFEVLEPKKFEEISRLVAERSPSRDKLTHDVIEIVTQDLDGDGIKATVTGRQKHFFSVYQKMVVRGREFNDIYDLVGIRVLVEDVRDCYAVLGAIHARWSPVPGRFKDYIAMPKFNLYQSLHTTVIGPTGKAIEIQIRTFDMHSRAEFGIAAHWKYKEKPSNDLTEWTSELNNISTEYPDPNEFLQHMKLDLYEDEIFCLTPNGDVVTLPSGSTAVDFAFAVHTEVGEKMIGAKVNGKLTNLSSSIKTGDTIEVLTTNDNTKGPSRDWLNIVKTSRARSKIKQWYQKQMKDEDIQKGKQILNIWLDDNTDILNFANKDDILKNILIETSLPNYEMFYQKLGNGTLKIDNIANKIRKFVFPEEITDDEDIFTPEVKTSENSELIIVEGYDDIQVRMAKCCVPVPGDDILGFVTISNGISVHRSDCMNIQIDSTKGERIIDVAWGFSTHTGNIIWLEIEAIDRPYLLRDATIAISDNGGNILVAKSVTSSKRIVSLVFQIEISDNTQLEEIIKDSKNIENVFEAARIFPGKK